MGPVPSASRKSLLNGLWYCVGLVPGPARARAEKEKVPTGVGLLREKR